MDKFLWHHARNLFRGVWGKGVDSPSRFFLPLSIYISIYLSFLYLSFIYLSIIYLSIYLYIYSSNYQSVYLSMYQTIYLSIYLLHNYLSNFYQYILHISEYLSIYIYISLSIYISFYLSIPIYLTLYLPFYLVHIWYIWTSILKSCLQLVSILLNILKVSLYTESFNTNIWYQLFDYKITFVTSQHTHTYSKGFKCWS